MSDLIRRADAIETVKELNRIVNEDRYGTVCTLDVLSRIKKLPSATCDDCIWHVCNYNKIDWDGEDGYISRQDAVSEIHKYFVEEIDKTPTEIDEDGDELYADMPTVNSLLACNKELSKRIKSLPSAEPKTGEWVMLERVENVHDIYGVPTWGVNYMCDKCGFIHTAIQDHFSQYKHCPKCGARMKGADDEREDIQSTDE